MGINGFSQSPVLSVLLAPLQAVAALFVPSHSACSYAPPRLALNTKRPALPFQVASRQPSTQRPLVPRVAITPFKTSHGAPSPSRLKVVREFEAGVSPSCAGRMVISGRMADVCAELDRMAQREASY